MLNRKIITGIALVLVTIGVFGGFFAVRAATVTPLKAGFTAWTVLNPIPKAVSGQTNQLYLFVLPQVSYGTAPYTVTVKIGTSAPGDIYSYTVQSFSGTGAPVLWSETAPSVASTLYIEILAVDNATGVSGASTTLHLPAY